MKKRCLFLAAGLAAAAAVPIALLAPGRASGEKKAPFLGRNFAHRGLHTPDKQVPENSLAAFRAAAECAEEAVLNALTASRATEGCGYARRGLAEFLPLGAD